MLAVVAHEVRNLARKSAEAAKGTTALIEGAVTAVDNGMKLVADTATSLTQVVEGTKLAETMVGKITESSSVQAEAIIRITQGIDQISIVVQMNSAVAAARNFPARRRC